MVFAATSCARDGELLLAGRCDTRHQDMVARETPWTEQQEEEGSTAPIGSLVAPVDDTRIVSCGELAMDASLFRLLVSKILSITSRRLS